MRFWQKNAVFKRLEDAILNFGFAEVKIWPGGQAGRKCIPVIFRNLAQVFIKADAGIRCSSFMEKYQAIAAITAGRQLVACFFGEAFFNFLQQGLE